jgi:hypothetical protein
MFFADVTVPDIGKETESTVSDYFKASLLPDNPRVKLLFKVL